MTGIFERRFSLGKFTLEDCSTTARIETESYDVTNRIAGFSRK